MSKLWLIVGLNTVLCGVSFGQQQSTVPLKGVPIEPVLIGCGPGDPYLIATAPEWSMTCWEDGLNTDFITADNQGDEIASGWIDESDPTITMGWSISPDGETQSFFDWAIDEIAQRVYINFDIIDNLLGTTSMTFDVTYIEMQSMLDGVIIDRCGTAVAVGDVTIEEPITIGIGIVLILGTGGKIVACQTDSLGQAKDGLTGCAAAFPGGGTNYQQCAECVQDKFHTDIVNCALSLGWNDPDDDYPACITFAWVQPGGDPIPAGGLD